MQRLCFFLLTWLCLASANAYHSKQEPGTHPSPIINENTVLKTSQAKDKNIAEDSDLGRLLYMNHCTSCHEDNAFLRSDSKVRVRADIEKWVLKWSTELKLGWDNDQREAVVDFLSREFYKFPEINN